MRLLADNASAFADRVGVPLAVRHVVVRDVDKPRVEACPRALLTTDPGPLFDDPEVEIVVEVMGGIEPAHALVERALTTGRSVVTANKALLAKHGPALFEAAAAHKVDIAFEAAVGGGIPIIRTLRDSFASDDVTEIVGILNGTSNYILSAMTERGESYEAALAAAQAKGFAEADPTLDVGGFDAAQKLLVLAMLAFGASAKEDDIEIGGIQAIQANDIQFAERFGFTIKHLVIGRDRGDAVELRAHPALVRKSSVLSNVSGALNAIKLEGRALGPCLLSGRGAGDMPTAVSVVADLLDVARGAVAGVPGLSSLHLGGGSGAQRRPLFPASDARQRFYLRFSVADRPGVMGRLAGALGDAGVSIEQIVQTTGDRNLAGQGGAEVIMITHEALVGDLRRALGRIDEDKVLARPAMVLRIEEA